MANEQMPPPGAEAPPAEGGDSGIVDLVSNISNGMAMLVEVLGASNVSPDGAQKLSSLAQAFGETMNEIISSQGGAGAQAQPSESPMEAGGNPNARPLGPQG